MIINYQYFQNIFAKCFICQLGEYYTCKKYFVLFYKNNFHKKTCRMRKHAAGRQGEAPRWALPTKALYPPWIFIMTGTISSATMLIILIRGLTAGPAVSL